MFVDDNDGVKPRDIENRGLISLGRATAALTIQIQGCQIK